jgi:non-specific serine/threonine protein kinase
MTHPWRVEMFGGLRARSASSPDQPVTRFRTQKTAALLAYLALKPGPQPREVLCGLLWPDSPPEAARNSLSASLSSLRRQFEEGQSADVIVADRLSAGLNPQSFTSDVAEFSQAQKRADAAPDDAARIEALSQAVEIYGGPLLPGFYDEWAVAEARCREEEFIAATSDLLDLLEDAEAWERAAAAARRGLGLQPDQEAWHLSVVRAHLALGRPGAALRQFEELKQVLERSGGTPSPRAQKLAARAREQAQQAPATPQVLEAQPQLQPQPQLPTQVLAPVLPSAAAPQVLAPPKSSPGSTQVLGESPQPAPGSTQVLEAPEAPPASLKVVGARLPTTLTRFFGRRLEITQIHRLLREDGERLVTLTGPGGSGKTRLAVEAARPLLGEWSETVAFVPLADLTDATFIFTAIRDALRLPAAPNLSPLEQVVEALSEAPALLLLDNFEQLVEDGAPLIQELLERLPLLSILITSRQVLGLPGEREYPVAPLPVPGEDASPERLKECSGTALFIDRAQAARVDFRVDERNARAVASICRRLDGIPLALELAAARSLVLSPAQMLEKLRSSSDLLSTRQRGVPERHRTLRAAIAWSYGLLSGELQQFFARLSVFRGGWTFEAAEEVCGEPEALDFLSRLRECSLIVTEERAGETRFRMLETLREYALEQLEAAERAAGEAAYCKYFVALAEESEPHLRGPEQAAYLERLEGEQDNFRAVLGWAMEHDASAALRLAAALAPFWETRGHYAEGRAWIEQALARTSAQSPSAPPPNTSPSQPSSSPASSGAAEEGESALSQARALHLAGRFAWFESDMGAAAARLEESLALFRAEGDVEGALEATGSLIMTRAWQGDERAAVALVREGMELRERIADRAAAVPTLAAFGCAIVFVASESVVPQARDVSEEALALARAAGDKKSEGVAQACLAAASTGKASGARPWRRTARAWLRSPTSARGGWPATRCGAWPRRAGAGSLEEARRCTEKSLRLQEGHRSPLGQPFCLDSCAMIAFDSGPPRTLGAPLRGRRVEPRVLRHRPHAADGRAQPALPASPARNAGPPSLRRAVAGGPRPEHRGGARPGP